MAITIITIALLLIAGFIAYLLKLSFFKISVRKEFDSRAVDLWDQRQVAKRNTHLNDEEKCIKLIELDLEALQLLEVIRKDDYRKGVKSRSVK